MAFDEADCVSDEVDCAQPKLNLLISRHYKIFGDSTAKD